jgi:NAD(P)-dependent dehydrogenase (short-subunit alcohol dehydrogenase family)
VRVFITGASSGIGRALALHYARSGASLGLTGRRENALRALIDALGSDKAASYTVDVRDSAAMRDAARDFTTRFGTPDIVIANAGISHGTRTGEPEDIDAFQAIIDTNLVGIVKTFQPFIAPMCARGQGKLVGIASVAGVRGLPGAGAYSSSKAAAINYLESLRVELQGSGVKVVTVMPGFIDTAMTRANPYPMPFIIGADDAARRIARIIERAPRVAVTPWPMAIVARALRWTPDWLYDVLTRNAPRKPRRH